MEVVILSGADADLDEIFATRENAEEFLVAVDRQLDLARRFPSLAPRALSKKLRKMKIKRTPFGIFYTVEGGRLMVIAIQDLRQAPDALARKLLARL